MANHDDAALRQAADRIIAERQRWEGVGLLAIENLETGACGLLLVPASVPAPDSSEELRIGAPGWEQHEDVSLAQWLRRWARDACGVVRLPTPGLCRPGALRQCDACR